MYNFSTWRKVAISLSVLSCHLACSEFPSHGCYVTYPMPSSITSLRLSLNYASSKRLRVIPLLLPSMLTISLIGVLKSHMLMMPFVLKLSISKRLLHIIQTDLDMTIRIRTQTLPLTRTHLTTLLPITSHSCISQSSPISSAIF